MDIALVATTKGPFDEAVARTRDALAEQGFGVLTEIDIRATLNSKLGGGAGDQLGDYLILGACNPQFAQQALNAYRQIGVLLPCNVVLRTGRDSDGPVVVEAMNPNLMAEVTDEPALAEIAAEVGRRLQAALDSL
ncbi:MULTISPECIES: DUF302 domain-containing protein [unclassified Mycolicibacterium]|uniref:DUF302 domain-containing protein n=1 Tax=unclassified Mycolicibacterium TaxID=2636767 RepID=UPI0012DD28A7|nr:MULTISPECIES: DUF302 domain-containing protein [unclassified Mycolicibacterium]MUL80211.1 DUF302 domain-containing protein [Mycolicibacterium sp. CBMA 329]MUL85978.1 DUF302 domain-containing protein [Mycolicibacterium sp. CBMA 331]MUM02999.1 DUF302 domain-containing protein [Mycolicibacterium sp. CBMA 334]MUM26812.1 DUF302 domain-containing protein [Mycolicibacterium sp. CBMA 295]MUM36274.1 DUF302 domain-containing protein [Mycolicibacterium sp. CBMA 247]